MDSAPPLLKRRITSWLGLRLTVRTYVSRNSKVESDLSWVPVGVLAGLE